jgi:phosphate:Na+ symporter
MTHLREIGAGTGPTVLRRWFSALFPPAREAATSRLNDEALAQPGVALDLIAREQLAVAQGLPHYLDEIREETRAKATASADMQHRRTVALLKQIARFTNLAARAESTITAPQVAQAGERTELLALLGDSIRELTDTMRDSMTSATLATLAAGMAEGLHVVLLSAVDAIESPDGTNLEVLHHLTADRGELMEGIRRSLVRGEQTLTLEEHQALFTSTRLFERIILLLRQLQTGLAPRA